jgi:hypothetical protein
MARYRHPKHGYQVFGYGDDLAALKAAGWVLDEPTPPSALPPTVEPAPAPPAIVPEAPPAPVPEPVVQSVFIPEVRRRGRNTK